MKKDGKNPLKFTAFYSSQRLGDISMTAMERISSHCGNNNQVGNLSCKDRVGLLVVFASSNATCWIFCTQIRGEKKKQQFPSPFFENTRSRQQCSLNKIQGQRASPLHGERAGSSHLVNCYLRSIDRLDVGSQIFANKYFRPPNGHIASWQTKSFGIRR